MDRKLGVTQDYDRSNYDSERAKKAYKEKTFGDHAVIIDPTTGKLLHKSQTNAQKKYHMKNADGENVSKKWATHSAETDHIHSLKSIHLKADVVKYMAEELGISEEVIIKKYNYGVYNEMYGEGYNMNADGKLTANDMAGVKEQEKDGKQFVEIGMWVDQDISSIGTIYDGVAIQ